MTEILELAAPIVVPLATLALGYVAGHVVYRKAKRAYSKAVDLLTAVRDAWEDDEVSTEEFARIVREAGEFADAIQE